MGASTLDYLIVYLEVDILCLLMSSLALFKTNRDFGNNRLVLTVKWFLRLFMLMMVVDAITHIQYRGFLRLPTIVIAFFYATYMSLLALQALVWLWFAEQQINTRLSRSKLFWIIASLPFVMVFVIAFASIRTGWFFAFDEAGQYVRGPLYALQVPVAYLYILFTTLHALFEAVREDSPVKRKRFLLLSQFIIAPIFGGVLQFFVGTHPFMAPSICVSFLYIFMSMQGDRINHDALTGLNNRISTDQYLSDLLPRTSEGNAFYYYIMDVDRFKAINDSYGHVEGDRALRTIADALRKTGDEFHGFIARFGGDEFVAIIEEDRSPDPTHFITALRFNLESLCNRKKLPYQISVSVGYTLCTSHDARSSEITASADRMLYQEKAQKKAARAVGG